VIDVGRTQLSRQMRGSGQSAAMQTSMPAGLAAAK
jgi:hypothetical protein